MTLRSFDAYRTDDEGVVLLLEAAGKAGPVGCRLSGERLLAASLAFHKVVVLATQPFEPVEAGLVGGLPVVGVVHLQPPGARTRSDCLPLVLSRGAAEACELATACHPTISPARIMISENTL